MQGEGVNSSVPGSTGPQASQFVDNTEMTTISANQIIYLSTIEKSRSSSKDHERDPAIPFLPPFQFPAAPVYTTPEALEKLMLDTQQKCINSICDNWSKQVEAQGEANKENLKERIRLGLDQITTAAVGGGTEADKTIIMASTTALLMIASTVIGQIDSIHVVSPTNPPGFSVINDLAVAAVNTTNFVAPDMRAELGLLGGLLATAVYYPAVTASVGKALGGAKEQEYDLEFAKNYAKQAYNLVKSPEFEKFISVLLFRGDNVDPKSRDNAVATMKLVMLFTALALVYRAEAGHVVGEDIQGMVDGTTKLPANDPRHQLILLINQLTGNMPQSEALKQAFYRYFNRNPSIEHILEPSRLAQGAAEVRDYERLGETRVD